MITETPAEVVSATAAEEEVSLQERLNSATDEERTIWERGGEFPPIKPKTPKTETPAVSEEKDNIAAPTARKPDANNPSGKPEPAAAPVAAKPQKRNGDARILQLLDERKKEREEFERKLADLESRLPKPAEPSVKTESQSAAAKTETKKARPKLGDIDSKTGKPFATIAEWETAVDAWEEERDKGLEERINQRLTQTEQQRTEQEKEQNASYELHQKFEPTRKKYADFDTVIRNEALLIPRGCPADLFVRSSKNSGEVMYYLAQHPEILASFVKETTKPGDKLRSFEDILPKDAQYMQLARIEAQLTHIPETPKTDIPKPSASTKPLPPPPTVLSAHGSPSGDPVEAAIKNKDFAAYEKEANAAERRARRA